MIYWPGRIDSPRQSEFPAFAGDILPTLLSVASVTYPDTDRPIDGINLEPVFDQDPPTRDRPIFFRHLGKAALIDNQWKLLTADITNSQVELYDLVSDPSESTNLIQQHTAVAKRMQSLMDQWNQSVDSSFAGQDYPAGNVDDDQPQSRFWTSVADYQRYLDQWQQRWEYRDWLKTRNIKK